MPQVNEISWLFLSLTLSVMIISMYYSFSLYISYKFTHKVYMSTYFFKIMI